ncbi:MAG: efflux RND transporter permease subunit [Deltaproteobacteria bacterium]|nr:efflux RND transporter permease subunit [Deltaproteobacteria bacterium]MBW2543293.1 efflux RND transporter permease subunit [Deltaproteobacteria bacterium]
MNRPIEWFARNHVAANLLLLLIIAGGISALPKIQQKIFPDIDVNMITIGVAYLGAAPEEVEEGVCVRIEEEIQGVDGIERIISDASEGWCGVTAELISGTPVDRVLSEIKNAVDSITTFPVDTEKPIVSSVQPRRNALQIAVFGDVAERTLKVYGERMRDEISTLPDVTQVELSGARNYEISIEVSEETLRRHGLTLDQVAAAVRRGSLDRPGGSIKTPAGEVLLRTKGQAYTKEEFDRIVVVSRSDGTRLLLGEIANIVDGFEEDDQFATFDGSPAVLIRVYRIGDQKVLDLVARVKEWVAGASARLPEGLEVAVWRDGSQTLRDRLDILIRNGINGFILVFVVLALFLRLRLAFWVSLGVPASFAGALALFPSLDISIDVISLFAFILVLGLLVDDAIVVGENVHRHQESGDDALVSAIRGTQEVATPVIFGILTTVAAFMPLLVSPGHYGQVFNAIGLVVVLCLAFSLIESQLVLPAHLGHMKINRRPGANSSELQSNGVGRWRRLQRATSGSLERFATRIYQPALSSALRSRYVTLAAGIAVLMIVISLVGFGHIKFSFFPPVESDYVTARIVMQPGTAVEATAAATREVELAARRMKLALDAEMMADGESLVRHIFVTVGEQTDNQHGPAFVMTGGGTNLGEVAIELASGEIRPIAADAIAQRWRDETPPIPGIEELRFDSVLFSRGDPIDIQLAASDVSVLETVADRVKLRLAEYSGVIDIADSFREGKQEIKLSLLPSAEPLGITLDDLSRQVRQAFYGAEAQRIQRGRDDVRVMVRYPRDQRTSLADLDNLRIRTPDGGEVPFYAVARMDRGRGYATINRSERRRVINVTADIDEAIANANEILADLESEFLPTLMSEYPGLRYDLEGVQREQKQTMRALKRDAKFALVLIFALLAVPLRSYGQPLIIMAVIPFGVVGAIVGHFIMRMDLSMMSVFGVVALSGVVINSSLVLVHYVNQRRNAGDALEEAVREAGVARFRPIVLTSMTTFAGLTPLLLEGSVSAQFLIPMAISLAFGVVFASSISLFLVPSLYLILEDVKRRVSQWIAWTSRSLRNA